MRLDKRGVYWCLCGLAGAVMAGRQSEQAARLLGPAEKVRGSLQIPLLLWRALYDRTPADARRALGEERFAAAWAEGQAMCLEHVIRYALERTARD